MSQREQEIDHLYRRAGFGASQEEVDNYTRLSLASYAGAVARLLGYEEIPDDVDSKVGTSGYVGVTARSGNGYQPAANILDGRQRWLFRMVHSKRPLQEKMALFWHNHFATAYSKVVSEIGDSVIASRMFAAKPDDDGSRTTGQLELFRDYALGNFRDLLVAVAKDPAMLVWLDGRTNVRARPQENFARELMELFTMGVGEFAETDVYAGARVFTGWNLGLANRGTAQARYDFLYVGSQHETSAKEFTFPIYRDGGRVIPARSGADGMQDGLDLIEAVARHPATGPRLARKLCGLLRQRSRSAGRGDDRRPGAAVLRHRLRDRARWSRRSSCRRSSATSRITTSATRGRSSSWSARSRKSGWVGFSLNSTLTPLVNMGQQLFEPPDVNGWELGRGWFSSGGMLARMNFAAVLATNQRFNLRDQSRGQVNSPESLLSFMLDRMTPPEFARDAYNALLDYTNAGGAWTGSDAQLAAKSSGLAHLIAGSGDYQLV